MLRRSVLLLFALPALALASACQQRPPMVVVPPSPLPVDGWHDAPSLDARLATAVLAAAQRRRLATNVAGQQQAREAEVRARPPLPCVNEEGEPAAAREPLRFDDVEVVAVALPSRSSLRATAIDPNTAEAATLTTLPGIGPALAARIVEHRPFPDIDDLLRVPGIGPATLERLRPYLHVGAPAPTYGLAPAPTVR